MSKHTTETMPPPDAITIHEIAFMHQIIQACAQRGAFKPDEFKDLGVLNEKLKSMLDYAKKLEEASKENEKSKDEGSVTVDESKK